MNKPTKSIIDVPIPYLLAAQRRRRASTFQALNLS